MEKNDFYDSNLRSLEEELIQYLIDSNFFFSADPTFKTILGYFFTRKELTQRKLKNLTGLSDGKISEELKKLEEMNLIRSNKLERQSITEPIIYIMDSIGSAFVDLGIFTLNISLKWQPKLLDIKKELKNNRKELQKLNGYEEILRFITFIFPEIQTVENWISKLKGYKESLK